MRASQSQKDEHSSPHAVSEGVRLVEAEKRAVASGLAEAARAGLAGRARKAAVVQDERVGDVPPHDAITTAAMLHRTPNSGRGGSHGAWHVCAACVWCVCGVGVWRVCGMCVACVCGVCVWRVCAVGVCMCVCA